MRAFACAVMHVLFREGFADRDYLARYTDCPDELEAHLKTRTPEWASAISGVPVAEIEAFARLVGTTKRSFFRLGYGFTRSRNGAAQMHAALCIPAVTGAWQYEGGGAFFNNAGIWRFDESIIEGHDAIDPTTRVLDQSKIGRILTGDAEALKGGKPVAGSSKTLKSAPAANGFVTTLQWQEADGRPYYDAGGAPGRAVGLK